MLSAHQWAGLSASLDLSGRQFEIAQCVFDDLKEEAIGAKLGLSPHTVHTHLERLYAKLGVHGRLQLVLVLVARAMSVAADAQN